MHLEKYLLSVYTAMSITSNFNQLCLHSFILTANDVVCLSLKTLVLARYTAAYGEEDQAQ